MIKLVAAISVSCCKAVREREAVWQMLHLRPVQETPSCPPPDIILAFAAARRAFPCGPEMRPHDHGPSYFWCGNGSAALSQQHPPRETHTEVSCHWPTAIPCHSPFSHQWSCIRPKKHRQSWCLPTVELSCSGARRHLEELSLGDKLHNRRVRS